VPDHKAWHAAHAVVLDAFAPADADADRKLGKLLKRRLPEHIARELFSYDGFLRALGKMNLSACCAPAARAGADRREQTRRRTAACTRCTRT
jgi:hypothetical protein